MFTIKFLTLQFLRISFAVTHKLAPPPLRKLSCSTTFSKVFVRRLRAYRLYCSVSDVTLSVPCDNTQKDRMLQS